MKAYLLFLKFYFSLLSFVSHEAAGKRLFKLAQRTRKLKFKPAEKQFYAEAHHFTTPFEFGDLHIYEIGDVTGPLVILVHGWESNAGSMSGAGKVLANQGYHVISFDLPAHGNHKATHTNLLESQMALSAVIERISPAEKFSIVAHSFGTAVSGMALSKKRYNIDHLVFLSTTNELIEFFEPLKKMLNIRPKTYTHVLQKVEDILDTKMEDVRMDLKLSSVGANNITIIHDLHDRILPYSNAENIAKHNAQTKLVTIEKAGHYRMLWNEEVLNVIENTFTLGNFEFDTERASGIESAQNINELALAI